MRLAYEKLLEKLGVSRPMLAYETNPWFHYDEGRGLTANAEVRIGPERSELEAEIQIFRDDTPTDADDRTTTMVDPGGHMQIFYLRAAPASQSEWSPKSLRVKGEDYTSQVGDWETKACAFFHECAQSLNMGQMPDFEELIERHFDDDGMFGGGRRGKIGRKSPKIKPAQLLGMKKGM